MANGNDDWKKGLFGAGVSGGPVYDQRVTSYNQSGGITAHTVHLRPARRDLSNPDAAPFMRELIQLLPSGLPVTVFAVAGDNEAYEFSEQIRVYLVSQGFKIAGGGCLMQSPPPPPGVTVNGSEVIVGHNP